jgi:hypothetical protein
MIPDRYTVHKNSSEIASLTLSHLIQNNEFENLLQITIENCEKEFEKLLNVSPLIQSMKPIGQAKYILGNFFHELIPWLGLPLYLILPLPLAIVVHFTSSLVISYLFIALREIAVRKSQKKEFLLQITANDELSKIVVDEIVKPFEFLLNQSSLNYREKQLYVKNIPKDTNEVQKIMKNAYLSSHQHLFDWKFQNVQLEQDKFLGGGSYGYVYKESINEQTYAVKVLNSPSYIYSEMLGNRLTHPNFVKIHFYSEMEVKFFKEEITKVKRPCLFMEFLSGKTLLKERENFSNFKSGEKIEYFLQIAEAVQHLQSLRIFYRDIKPENIMLVNVEEIKENKKVTKKMIKFIDFGTSKTVDTGGRTIVGTVEYMTDEIYQSYIREKDKPKDEQKFETEKKYDFSCDIFSLGITFAELWEGKGFMVDRTLEKSQVSKLSKNKDESEVFNKIEEMIQGCCMKEIRERWKIEQVVKTLSELKSK